MPAALLFLLILLLKIADFEEKTFAQFAMELDCIKVSKFIGS